MYRLVGSVVPLAIGVFFMVRAYQLSIGELTDPGPGLWPFIASAVIVVSSVVALVVGSDNEGYERFTSGIATVALGLLSLGVFILLFEQIGFVIPGFLTLVFWLRFIGGESWRLTLIISGIAILAFYVVFVVLLGVPIPSGVFGF